MNGARLSRVGLVGLRSSLSERDLSITSRLGEFRLMTAGQIQALHFPTEEFSSELSATRVARRVLERLTRQGVITRLKRRVGGVSAGSSGFTYGLGPAGVKLLQGDGPRRHYREPSEHFLMHTLAISELAVDLLISQQRRGFDVLQLGAEPKCWRTFQGAGGQQILRPDLFVSLGVGDFEHRLFVEVDLGTEHVPTLLRKCHAYVDYYQSGAEQTRHGVFPTVWWVLQTERRVEKLTKALARSHRAIEGLFTLTTAQEALDRMTGGKS